MATRWLGGYPIKSEVSLTPISIFGENSTPVKNPVIIFGANYLGRAAKEIFEANEIVVYGFLDDDKKKLMMPWCWALPMTMAF